LIEKANNTIQEIMQELRSKANFILKKELQPPNNNNFVQIEDQIKITFPEDCKFFLTKTYDLYYGTLEPFVLTDDENSIISYIYAIKDARQMGVPEHWLPICEDNGNYYCLLPDGSVHFWDHNGTTDEKWNSLADWINIVWIQGN
jgi:hypothetical protein